MMKRRYVGIVLFALLAAGILFAVERAKQQSESATDFFSNALRNAQIETEVSIDGIPYRMADGSVQAQSGTTTKVETLSALRLAYAQALARRSPVFGLVGTDPDALENAVQSMRAAQERLAALQASRTDAESIFSLYPVRFLQELASLERARQAFLSSGSDTDSGLYDAQARKAVQAGKSDASAFGAELERFLSDKSSTMLGLGGAITTDALIEGAALIPARMDEVSAELSRRARCTGGHHDACDATDISAAMPPVPPEAPEPVGNLNLAQEALLMLTDASSALRSSPIYELTESACLSELPAPYYFVASPSWQNTPTLQFHFVGDLYFQNITPRLRAAVPFFEYLASERNISYMRVNPTMFYVCPEFGDDLGHVRALQAIARFATAHPSIAPSARALLASRTLLKERDELAYLRAALLDTKQKKQWDEFNSLADLSLMYTDRSIGLESVVFEIARVTDTRATRVQEGIPFDVSAWQLYLTHTAFPTLFLAGNPSAGTSAVSIRKESPGNPSLILNIYSNYSSLRASVPSNVLAHDIESMFDLDNNMEEMPNR